MSVLARIAVGLACLAWLSGAHAHLISAQRGTLNIVDGGGFLMLSLPASAFEGIDDDGDGRVSLAELRAHYEHLDQSVRQHVRLADKDGPFLLEGIMLTLSHSHDSPGASAGDQVVVMGRFALRATGAMGLHIGLFGKAAAEQLLEVTVTRGANKQRLKLTPARPSATITPP